jgi:hypothetical protein
VTEIADREIQWSNFNFGPNSKMLMNTLKKIVASSVVITTVLSLVVAVAPVKAAASAGDLIKQSGNSSVYYLGADSKRYVFPNEATYKSWYSDFSMVKVIPQAELEGYGIGGNVTMRPGTKLVKITTNPKVYAVTPGGNLVAIPDESTAKTLYGATWAKKIVDVPDAFFINYKDTGKTLTSAAYPAGALVKYTVASPDLYYVNADGTVSKIADESAFNANRFQGANIQDGSSVSMPAQGAAITGAVATDLTSGAGTVVYTGGSAVTVALSGMTAASASVISTNNTNNPGQSLANLASFNFTASNDGSSLITGLKLKRLGISQDATLKNVYLYEGANRLTDAAAVSSGIITFSNSAGIIAIPAGQTKTLTVRADIAGGVSGETLGVAITAMTDVTTNGAAVTGQFPATGNLMSVVQTSNLATVALSAPTPAASDVNPGDSDISVFKTTATVSSHDVSFKYLRLREIGSIASTDLKDFNLYANGVKVAGPVQLTSDYYVSFDLSAAPVSLLQGGRVLEVRATVVSGSAKDYTFSVRYPVDIVVEDVQYGVAVSASGTGVATGKQSVQQGTMTVVKKSDSASGSLTKDTTSASLAKYTLTAFGEAVKIDTLNIGYVSNNATSTYLRNGKILANGAQIGSTANLAKVANVNSTGGTQYTVNYTVYPGTPVTIEIVADIVDTVNSQVLQNADTIQAVLIAPTTSNAQAQTSLKQVSVPGSNVAANAITVKTGSISGSKTGTYGNQTVVTPQTAYKIGSYVVSGNSTEDVNLNTFTVTFAAVAPSTLFTAADLTDVYVKYGVSGEKTTSIKPTVTGSNSFSVSSLLAKNGAITVDVYATVGADTGTSTITSTLTVDGQTAGSNAVVSTGSIPGQNITAGAGNLTLTSQNSDNAVASRIVTGASTQQVQKIKFVATNDAFTITDIYATTTAAGATNVVSASITDGTLTGQAVNSNGALNFTGLNFVIPAGSTGKILTISIVTDGVGTGAGTSGADIQTSVIGYKANGSQGNLRDSATFSPAFTPVTGNSILVFKSIPTITNVALPVTQLAAGTQTIGKFTITADAQGSIEFARLIATISSTTNVTTFNNFKLYDYDNQATALSTGSVGAGVVTFDVAPQTVTGTKTYIVKANIQGNLIVGESVTFSIQSSAAAQVGLILADQKAAGATFVWSDLSDNAHSATTLDWFSDKLIKNLPTDTQSLSR